MVIIMIKTDAERIVNEYMKPIYGFALKRCANAQDAEDLAQEICLRVYRAMLERDDIASPDRFVWTASHNALANYYRGKSTQSIGIPIDDLADTLPSEDDIAGEVANAEAVSKLHEAIAYLSKTQRQVVIMYYYENRRQEDISRALGIPLGTVKWHLFESKKELRKGIDIMRQPSELKFNPINFAMCGTNGSVGTKGGNGNFFRSALSQNIAYSVLCEAKTVNEIAETLGVSPVYVESEAEFLEEYGFLVKQGDKYLINILLDEPTTELNRMRGEMYEKAAKIFANELYDELEKSEFLDGEHGVVYNPLVGFEKDLPIYKKDKNFVMWSLIPYIAALSGEKFMDETVSFDEAATLRPDGGKNICYASVLDSGVEPMKYSESMGNWFGPCWNANDSLTLWSVDSEWSGRRKDENYHIEAERALSLFGHLDDGLSADEYAWMVEKGYLKTAGDIEGNHIASIQVVWLMNTEIKRKLLEIGDRIKEKHKDEFDKLKEPYIKAILANTPKHLRKMQSFGLQFIFYSDGWFLLYCLKELVNNGKLKEPTETQRKSLTTIIVSNK
jgi:RNA polymerase sigma factor (sigma-70 family)